MMVKRSDLTLCVFSINDHSHRIKRWSVDDLWMTYGWSLICVVERDYSTVHQHMPKPIRIYESFKHLHTISNRNKLTFGVPSPFAGTKPRTLSITAWRKVTCHDYRKKQQSSASISQKKIQRKVIDFSFERLIDSIMNPFIHSKNSNRLQLIFTVNPFQPVSRSWLLHLKSCSSTSKIQNLLVRKSTGIYSKQETTGSKASWKSHPILFHLDNFD